MLVAVLMAGMAPTASSKYHEPYEGSRLFWDVGSQKVIFPTGNYARMVQLQDSRLMAVCCDGGNILMSFSSDGGNTWSSSEVLARGTETVPLFVPDLVQLADGTILVAYNPRPTEPYSVDRRFGIRVLRSVDNAKTWEGPIFVFDAQHTFGDGCWEPSFLELPSGEIHCYFANENPFTTSDEQEISVCRSFDKGLTWGEPERVCFRAGSRDGMPSAIITDAGEIVVIVEDNGHPGYQNFHITTMRCSLEDNWKTWVDADSPNRNMIFANEYDKGFISAAPYIRKLKSGETIASWQGNHGDRNVITDLEYMDMFVAVGDADARNFKSVTEPFALPITSHGIWNSVSVIDDGTVFALSSIGVPGSSTAINMMKGYAMKGFHAGVGTPEIDASCKGETWTEKNARQVYMGYQTRCRATMDFLYDNENLYFYAMVVDRTIYTDKIDNDGVFAYFDFENACDTYPQDGMFKLFLNIDGSVDFYSGNENKWHQSDELPAGIRNAVKVSKTYYEVEVAVPWSALGFENPPVDRLMRCNIEIRDRRDSEIVWDRIPETTGTQSWTWPEFRLDKAGDASVGRPAADGNGEIQAASFKVSGSRLSILAQREINDIQVYNMTGALVASSNAGATYAVLDLPCGPWPALVRVNYADGSFENCKIMAR